MADDKKEKKEDKMTPEEKLFRAIVNEKQSYDDFDDDFVSEDEEDSAFHRMVGVLHGLRAKVKAAALAVFGLIFKQRPGRPEEISSAVASISGGGSRASSVSAEPPAVLAPLLKIVRLRTLNQGMGIVLVLMGLYLVLDIVLGLAGVSKNKYQLGQPGPEQEVSVMPAYPGGVSEPLSRYIAPAEKRNIFLPPDAKPAAAGQPAVTEAPALNYRLVGISWDADELVAMVEYEAERRASFVRKDETLPGGAKVVEVTEYSVTLSYNGRQWEVS